MSSLRLFPFSLPEARLLARVIDFASVKTGIAERKPEISEADFNNLRKLKSVLSNGGFCVYVGSVTDQDGDSAWELTASLNDIRTWSNDLAALSYELPRSYKVKVTRSGFGSAHRLKLKPNKHRSQFFIDWADAE